MANTCQIEREFDSTALFLQQIGGLYLSNKYSDIKFIVAGQKIPAHRMILAMRCPFFAEMLYVGDTKSSQDVIELNVPLVAFKTILEYIYSGSISLTQIDEKHIFDALSLSDEYGLIAVTSILSANLERKISLENCFTYFNATQRYDMNALASACMTFMDRHAASVLTHPEFHSLTQSSLYAVLQRDTFFAEEIDIFKAVLNWRRLNEAADVSLILSLIRLPLMTYEQILTEVRSVGLYDQDTLLDALAQKTKSDGLALRAALWPEENMASTNFKSKTISGGNPSALLDGDISNYTKTTGYTFHAISDSCDDGIIVELGALSIINHIKMLLWDTDNRGYSYYIQTSVDNLHWDCVIDHKEYLCRSWQSLYFPSRMVRFIKVIGTRNTADNDFHVVALEAKYMLQVPEFVGGLVKPTYNVAAIKMSASVKNLFQNDMLNGDSENYTNRAGYSYHQLSNIEGLIIQLSQPFIIDSLRLLLWDRDERRYGFYIETSTDESTWTMAVDKRDERLRSWQGFKFDPRPVLFIRIVGTFNSANGGFHCVHFECPSQIML